MGNVPASSCLICISGIKKNDEVWNCQSCFDTFHLSCIQRWAKDSIFQQKNELEEESSRVDMSQGRPTPQLPRINLKWSCPKCRTAYEEKSVPSKYTCYCGKVVDPVFDPWSIPHSCGDVCGRQLLPECGHKCLILCHPGPCPPCPKMVRNDCHCRNSAPATRRCFEKRWSCGKPCGQRLNCNQHKCPDPCHEGDCLPCNKTSVQLCKCRRQQKTCDCASPAWQCKEKCGKPLDCGHHICDEICHAPGQCPPCQLSQLRTCPCGKSKYQLECTVATPTCGDTCGKPLGCPGDHVCVERCHRGKCGSCLQMVTKQCRCSQSRGEKGRRKELPCTKEYICETKCKKMRDCRRHACNRKCCIGDCPACEQPCNKQLSCKNHKCASRCHPSRCYPCNETKEVSCYCGHSRFLVPCGMERSTKPPRCRNKCKAPTDCHHASRVTHSCHFGPCPGCRQVCEKSLKCGHNCLSPCHDNVKVKVEDTPARKAAATPWELQKSGKPDIELKALDCPDCEVPVSVTCLGGHETTDWPCFKAKPSSCGRNCGRKLPCGNHFCERSCHKVKNAPNEMDSGANCRKCESGCTRSRPEGCNHPCQRACHDDPCDTCLQLIRIRCHCELTQLYVECEKWIKPLSEEERESLGCCKDQCPKLLSCGHRCFLTCHSGKCGDESLCRKKCKIYCHCKRKKKDILCKERGGNVKIECDQECRILKSKNPANEVPSDKKKRELEEKLAREEAERFEKLMSEAPNNPAETSRASQHSRKRKNRRRASQDTELSFIQKHKMRVLIFIVSTLTTIFIGYILNRD